MNFSDFMKTFEIRFYDLVSGFQKNGYSSEAMCKRILGVSTKEIRERVILSAFWKPSDFGNELGTVSSVSAKIWEITSDNQPITFIQCENNASSAMDAVLTLGLTACKRVVFVSPCETFDAQTQIGDLLIPEYAVSGDGASCYITSAQLEAETAFLKPALPSKKMFQTLCEKASAACAQEGRNVRSDSVLFSSDSIFATHAHLEQIQKLGCSALDKSTAAVFRAASLAELDIGAIAPVVSHSFISKTASAAQTEEMSEFCISSNAKLLSAILQNTLQ